MPDKVSIPIPSMYSIFTYIYHKNQLNVGKYTSPMDGMGSSKWPSKWPSNLMSSKERSANSAARSSPWATAWGRFFRPSWVPIPQGHPEAEASQMAQKVGSRISPSSDWLMKPCHNFSTCQDIVDFWCRLDAQKAFLMPLRKCENEVKVDYSKCFVNFRNNSKNNTCSCSYTPEAG